MRLVVGISGSSGVIYGVRLLEVLRELKVESYLVMSTAAKETLVMETDKKVSEVEALASEVLGFNDIAASIASGSFRTDGMAVIPCSMKTLAGIATGYSDNLLLRAADVTLKERRPLVVVPREAPLTTIHLENMLRVANAGGIIVPAAPAFYTKPKTIEDMVDHTVGKVLDLFHVNHKLYPRWNGPSPASSARSRRLSRASSGPP